MEARRDEINSALTQIGTRQEIRVLAAGLMTFFGASRVSEEEADVILEGYWSVLKSFPVWLIVQVFDDYRNGIIGDGNFAPKPPKVAEECRKRLVSFRAEAFNIDKILNAHVYREPTDEERERVKKGFESLLRELSGGEERP